ncbi:hypothetical protein K501DRAFT_273669 [Backusella circina FSU 941]|nr:hypothetical protein K501DRAFT_273669 [Backusella circina FSU 941]
MSFTEDDSSWDTDVILNSSMMSRFTPRHSVDTAHIEKEMLLACQRSMLFNNSANSALDPYDDDTNSSLSSYMSDDKYSLDDPAPRPNPLDDFMYNTVPPLTIDSTNMPGVVRRLGGRNNRTEDDGDWATDISFNPSILLKSTTNQHRTKENEYYSNLTIDDDNDSFPTLPTPKVPEPIKKEHASFVIVPENFEDAHDLSELEVSDCFTNSPLSNMKRKQQEAESSRQAVSSTFSLLDRIEKEHDEEDFCKDLEFDDGTFTQKSPQKQQDTKKKIIATPSSSSSKKTTTSSQIPQATRSRFLNGTIASRQREITVAAERMNRSKSSNPKQSLRKKTLLKQTMNDPPPAKRTSPTGTTLITRPLGKSAYNGNSRLDTLDNLVDVKKQQLTVKKVVIRNKDVDPQRPWRNNMTKRQPVLIQPHQNTSKKVIDNMIYDKSQGLWKGNETVLNDFKPPRRMPLLISNKQTNKPGAAASKYTSATVNGMVFKEDTLQWVKPTGEVEDNTLDSIEDLKVSDYQQRPQNILSDFAISNTKKQALANAEKEHTDWVMYWPIAKNERMVVTRSGHKVGASKYMLF